ncbi:MAG TPA: hypothetical protein VM261_19255 [Kofleriaceae bacterium]|nr:hypothetical protein [Kofleriaceae bacterium]
MRVAVLALALIVVVAQVAWARGAVCVASVGAHEACKCCEERAKAPAPVIAGDCCAVEESPPGAAVRDAVAVVPAAAAALAVLPAAVLVPAARPAVVPETLAEVEARCAGPPLWLRLRSLRL